jgi:hypothetical protein
VTQDEYEDETIRRALDGDAEAGREALRLCRSALDARSMSPRLTAYLADRLAAIEDALDEAEKLRRVKKSSGSIRSARDAAIAEALCVNRPAKKPRDPFPEWQVKYAAFGLLLQRALVRPERVKAAMDEARRWHEGNDSALDRRTAERLLAAYKPLLAPLLAPDVEPEDKERREELLLHLAGPLREIVPTYLPQTPED